jgi:tripartite-type tricarboxylate transporter receptor subunit TctC
MVVTWRDRARIARAIGQYGPAAYLLLSAPAGVVSAAEPAFPVKPVRIVVPFPAGGSFDVTARLLAPRMQAGFGQNVVIENRPGGGTVVGTDYVVRQPPDGHTMLMIGVSFTSHAVLRSKLNFDTDRDFRAVSPVIGLTMTIAVNPSLPVKSLAELIKLAHARPGEINCASSGQGTSHHLLIEALKLSTKANIVHTPFQGSAHSVPLLVGGHITAFLGNIADVIAFVKTGKVRPLAVLSPARDELVPDVPTVREVGYPQLEAINWSGFVVHSATPSSVVNRLNAESVKALNLPEVRDHLRTLSITATPGSPEQFAALIKSDAERYRRIIREANVRLE